MAQLTGLLGGYNEQRADTGNYLAQLDQMQRAAIAQQLERQRMEQQAQQFGQSNMLQQQQLAQTGSLRQAEMAQAAQAHRDALAQQAQQFGLQTREQQFKETTQNASTQRQDQARNALAQLLNGPEGGDIATADLARVILPYDIGQGASLLKASKEEQRQQSLLDKTGGTGIQPDKGYRWNAQGNQEFIPGSSADPAVIARLEQAKLGGKNQKLTSEQQKIVDTSNAGLSTLDRAMALTQQNPEAFGQSRGLPGNLPLIGGPGLESAVGKFDTPTQQAARGAVYQEAAAVAHELLGSAQSPTEKASVQAFLPSPYDNAEQITVKLQGMKQYMETKKNAVLSGAPAQGQQSGASAGTTFSSLPDPRQYSGRTVRDPSTGMRMTSNGSDWIRQ